MRRAIFVLFLIFMLAGMAGLTAGLALYQFAPFQPGQPYYWLQDLAEHSLFAITLEPVAHAHLSLDLLDRRIVDLQKAAGLQAQNDALSALVGALDSTLSAVAQAPEQAGAELRARMVSELDRLKQTLGNIQSAGVSTTKAFSALVEKVAALQAIVADPTQPLSLLARSESNSGTDPALPTAATPIGMAAATGAQGAQQLAKGVSPHMVIFPKGSIGAMHAFFPLEGKHAALECKACHSEGRYAGTAKDCTTCHKADAPQNHYPAECNLCHNSDAWKPANFSHAAVDTTNCVTCHQKNTPANHWNGQCSECHSTKAWKPASFNHQAAGAANCQSCHNRNKPANHWNGQCSGCHSTNAWKPASFNHQLAGATNCQSCHNKNKPANHWNGQCSGCHSTNAWKPASFNHQFAGATDCQSCHNKNKPANHWNGQCSGCHNTNAWKPASFNHQFAGATDCQACHGGNKPANHFDGQCSGCHNTDSWKGATFNHPFPMDHGGAGGNCATCHPGGGSAYTCFNCHNQGEMDNKHSGIPNYASRCTDCHANGNKPGD
jgi:ElaB/YqjD/DUF883 family membrane-anchored ribosome-binding protein